PTAWVVTRGAAGTTAHTHSTSAVLLAYCAPNTSWEAYWQFTSDPNLTDTTGAFWTIDPFNQSGGHDDTNTGYTVFGGGNGWEVRPGSGTSSPITQVTQPIVTVGNQNLFAGAFSQCYGN